MNNDDKRKVNLDDKLKHIVSELNVINIMTQLAMADLDNYMKDKDGMNKKEE